MNPFERLHLYVYTEIWPWLKVRGRFYWWVVRYGGKKRIPKDVIMKAMAASFERMNLNLQKAQDATRLEDLDEEERMAIRDARLQSKEIQASIERVLNDKHVEDRPTSN